MSTENNKQLIYIFNAIGHCGHFLTWIGPNLTIRIEVVDRDIRFAIAPFVSVTQI